MKIVKGPGNGCVAGATLNLRGKAMKVQCPNCGGQVVVNGLGRKSLDIPFKIISEALKANSSVELAAETLNCSVGYIYQELRKKGLKPGGVK